MKKGKFHAIFERDFLFNFILIEMLSWCLIVTYVMAQVFDLNTGVSRKDALAALIVSVAGLIIYIVHRIISVFFK
ncbi:hypothetical protein EON80_26570 [bacterium]|nr:MAG: hypothetical protein EON80_26570 [bacterium]